MYDNTIHSKEVDIVKKTKNKKKKNNKNTGNILSALFGAILCISVLYICISAANQDSTAPTDPTEAPTVVTTAPTEILTEPVTEAPTEASTEETEATEPAATEPETDPVEETTESAEGEHTYLLNTSTKKFHETDCSRGPTKESNKQYFTGTREEVIQQGYVPCKICNP